MVSDGLIQDLTGLLAALVAIPSFSREEGRLADLLKAELSPEELIIRDEPVDMVQ